MGMNFEVYIGAYLRILKKDVSDDLFEELFYETFANFKSEDGGDFYYATPNTSEYNVNRTSYFGAYEDSTEISLSRCEESLTEENNPIIYEFDLFSRFYKNEVALLMGSNVEFTIEWGILTSYR